MSVSERDELVNHNYYIEGTNGLYRNYNVKHEEVKQYYRKHEDIDNVIWWTHILYDNAYEYIMNNNIEKYIVVYHVM